MIVSKRRACSSVRAPSFRSLIVVVSSLRTSSWLTGPPTKSSARRSWMTRMQPGHVTHELRGPADRDVLGADQVRGLGVGRRGRTGPGR